jgi:hypothetical protein
MEHRWQHNSQNMGIENVVKMKEEGGIREEEKNPLHWNEFGAIYLSIDSDMKLK